MTVKETAINEEIAHGITVRTLYGMRLTSDIYRRILEMLIALENELRNEIYRTNVLGVSRTAYQKARQASLYEAVGKEIRSTYSKIKKTTSSDLGELTRIEAKATKSIINSAGSSVEIKLGAGLPPPSVLTALTDDIIVSGTPMLDFWTRQEYDTFTGFKRAVQLGLTSGESNEQIVKRIVSDNPQVVTSDGTVMSLSKKNARILVAGSVQSVQNTARVAVFEENADLFEGIYHLSVLDSHTSKICIARNGKMWDTLTKEPIGHNLPFAIPPLHPRCLVGDSLVSPIGGVSSTSKRWMDGEVFTISTASGRKLTTSPNHPILTSRGWMAASLLKKGDKVVCVGTAEGALRGIGYDKNVVAKIHDLSKSVFRSGNVCSVPMPMSAPYFHGDGADSKVAIININSDLLSVRDAAFIKKFGKVSFRKRIAASLSLFSQSPCQNLFSCSLSAFGGIVRGFNKVVSPFLVKIGPTIKHLFSDCVALPLVTPSNGACLSLIPADPCLRNGLVHARFSDPKLFGNLFNIKSGCVSVNNVLTADLGKPEFSYFNSTGLEKVQNGGWADAEHFAQLLSTNSTEIELDDVIGIVRSPFSGHVYNLETSSSVYVANGIINHNCRSVITPKVIGGRFPPNHDTNKWLKSRPVAEIEQLLGKKATALYLDGHISADELIDQNNRPLTLKELEAL